MLVLFKVNSSNDAIGNIVGRKPRLSTMVGWIFISMGLLLAVFGRRTTAAFSASYINTIVLDISYTEHGHCMVFCCISQPAGCSNSGWRSSVVLLFSWLKNMSFVVWTRIRWNKSSYHQFLSHNDKSSCQQRQPESHTSSISKIVWTKQFCDTCPPPRPQDILARVIGPAPLIRTISEFRSSSVMDMSKQRAHQRRSPTRLSWPEDQTRDIKLSLSRWKHDSREKGDGGLHLRTMWREMEYMLTGIRGRSALSWWSFELSICQSQLPLSPLMVVSEEDWAY